MPKIKMASQSPTPVSPVNVKVNLNFSDALQAVTDGKKIHKLEWKDREFFGILKDGILQLHKPDGFHSWIVSEGDLLGDDYIIL